MSLTSRLLARLCGQLEKETGMKSPTNGGSKRTADSKAAGGMAYALLLMQRYVGQRARPYFVALFAMLTAILLLQGAILALVLRSLPRSPGDAVG
jgi:hypothetical protein